MYHNWKLVPVTCKNLLVSTPIFQIAFCTGNCTVEEEVWRQKPSWYFSGHSPISSHCVLYCSNHHPSPIISNNNCQLSCHIEHLRPLRCSSDSKVGTHHKLRSKWTSNYTCHPPCYPLSPSHVIGGLSICMA